MPSSIASTASCRANVALGELTWYRLGGPARWLFEPHDEDELRDGLARFRNEGIAWRVLGRGANVLIPDEGFPGVVIRLTAPAFTDVRIESENVVAGGGADFQKLIRATLDAGLTGLEAFAGIPGFVGGIVRMNAGGKYGVIGDFATRVRSITPEGQIIERGVDQLAFAYRQSNLTAGIVLRATFGLHRGDRAAATERYRTIWNEKSADQPALALRSAGCIFKNPAAGPAGKLIDDAGLKGVRIGGAEVSTRHANFIVADATATAADVRALIQLIQDRVRAAHGVELEPEIDLW